MNKENLTKLANYLLTVPAEKFHMDSFARDEHGERLHFPLTYECATVACAVGHGPAAGIEVQDDDINWLNYSERAFGMNPRSYEWTWCFAGSWTFVDNTAAGAAKRILHLVEHGLPKNAVLQRLGEVPYLFGAVN